LYGRDGAKVFINAKIRIAFTQNDEKTCQLISSMLGNTTVAVKNRSRPIGGSFSKGTQHNESIYYVAKHLILPQEIRLLPENKALVLVQGSLQVLVEKVGIEIINFPGIDQRNL
jgi:type IV secretory pathway TraG/TraD family ATPase VirD4